MSRATSIQPASVSTDPDRLGLGGQVKWFSRIYTAVFWGAASGWLFAAEITAFFPGLTPFRSELAWVCGTTAALFAFVASFSLVRVHGSQGAALASWMLLPTVVAVASSIPAAAIFGTAVGTPSDLLPFPTAWIPTVWFFSVPQALIVGFIGFAGVVWLRGQLSANAT